MSHARLLAALTALLLSASAFAATVAERSPFTQGLWWEPARSGSGFEMFNAGGQVMVIWYTFDAAGKPTWYTAQGSQQSLGESWPLLKHRWADGVKQEPTNAGSLALSLANPESAEVRWQVGTQGGVTKIEPFLVSGVIDEVDRSGTWFDPANSGWGLTVLEQGEMSGAALFTYGIDGEPTWAAGFERGKGSVELFVSSGACPWCTYRQPTTLSAGRVNLDFTAESALVLGNRTSLPMAAGLRIEGASMTQLSRPASTRAADRQLARFDAASLLAYFRAGLRNLPPPSLGDFSASPPAAAFSPTNVQVQGVDEAALVKSNGTHVYTYAHQASTFARKPEIRIARVEAQGAVVKAVGSVSIGTGDRTPLGTAGLYLDRDNLISVHGGQSYGTWQSGTSWSLGLTQVEILDLSNPELPVSRWRADLDGYLIASRRVGSTLYLVSRFTPSVPGFLFGAYTPAQQAANEQLIAATSLDTFLPKARTTDDNQLRFLVRAEDMYAAPQGARKAMADMIMVTAIDIDARRIKQTIALAGYVDAVYASPGSVYLASSRYEPYIPGRAEPTLYRTDLHQIALGNDGMSLVGSGSVEGYLDRTPEKAPLRIDEHGGKLRVVTTSQRTWGTNSNRVTILQPSLAAPGLLKTLAWLPNVSRPEPLGKPGESLYATRFAGDRLYAVTFRQVDPLYVVDLANPADPKIAAALEIPGFSEYLHPLPNGLLLGFGKDAVPALDFGFGDGQGAWFQGLLVSLYDVSDAARPVQLQRLTLGKRGSTSALLSNHQAFSALPRAGSLDFAIPARIHDGVAEYGSGPGTTYRWDHSGLMRFELQGSTAADARMVQKATLKTHQGTLGVYTYDPAISDGRSVLFPEGSLYVGAGRFWHQDSFGNTTGPF